MNEDILTEITEQQLPDNTHADVSEEISESHVENTEEAEESASEESMVEKAPEESAAKGEAPSSETEQLLAQISSLRRELEEKNAAHERMSREISEFSELFPERSITSLPDSVWESVKSGIPLAAAYALYERRAQLLAAQAEAVNEKNSTASTGPIGKDSDIGFFTPDEVRAMSRQEVRQNYSKILDSMKKWN